MASKMSSGRFGLVGVGIFVGLLIGSAFAQIAIHGNHVWTGEHTYRGRVTFDLGVNEVAWSLLGADLGVWRVSTGTLTAAQVRTLNATPVRVIEAPGAGLAVHPVSMQFHLDFNSNAYDSVGAGEDFVLVYENLSTQVSWRCDSTTCLDMASAVDTFGIVEDTANLGYILTADEPVAISVLSGELAAADDDSNGDSPIHYLIRYRIVTVDLS